MADVGGAELDAFRKDVRAWLEENYPASLRKDPDRVTEQLMGEARVKRDEDVDLWRKRIGEKGWGTPTWPKKYGGGGLSQAEARVLQEEMARIGARNPIQGMGPGMFGHTLLEYGNEEQKLKHFPPICRGELRWCQGFSEPGSGSDLASLQTKAVDMGDHYLVNGQKIWTSGAHLADWCFCLVRTDPTKKHEGISFLLIDMHSPGRRSAADQDDLGRVRPVRDLLHRREGAEGEPGRDVERRLADRQAPPAARAQRHGQPPGRRGHARDPPASPTSPRNTSASTRTAGWPTRICAPASSRTGWKSRRCGSPSAARRPRPGAT